MQLLEFAIAEVFDAPEVEALTGAEIAAVPAGSYLMCFRFLQVAWSFWKTGGLPHHDETRVEGNDVEGVHAPPQGATR